MQEHVSWEYLKAEDPKLPFMIPLMRKAGRLSQVSKASVKFRDMVYRVYRDILQKIATKEACTDISRSKSAAF